MTAAVSQKPLPPTWLRQSNCIRKGLYMEEEKKGKEAAIDQERTDCPILTVKTGNVLLHIGLHFNEKKEVTADDLFHRLVTERVLKNDF